MWLGKIHYTVNAALNFLGELNYSHSLLNQKQNTYSKMSLRSRSEMGTRDPLSHQMTELFKNILM